MDALDGRKNQAQKKIENQGAKVAKVKVVLAQSTEYVSLKRYEGNIVVDGSFDIPTKQVACFADDCELISLEGNYIDIHRAKQFSKCQ